MPELPDSSAPELSSEDRLAVFLASAAQSGGRLTPAAWDGASDVLASVFAPDDTFMGEARRRAEQRYFTLQTRFHAALLQPAVPLSGFSKDSRLADDVAALPPDSAARFCDGVEKLSAEHGRFLRALRTEAAREKPRSPSFWKRGMRMLPGNSAWDEMFGEGDAAERGDSRAVIMENGVAQPRRRQGALVPEALRRQMGDFSARMSEAGSACGSMAEDAARYLRGLDVQRMLSAGVRRDAAQVPAAPLARAADAAEELRDAALAFGAAETARAAVDLRRMMMEQPYAVVVVGEGKRGKKFTGQRPAGDGAFTGARIRARDHGCCAFPLGQGISGRSAVP